MEPEQNPNREQRDEIAVPANSGITHENPLSILMHGREMMAHPIFDHELSAIQGATVVGSAAFGLACLTLGTYVNYSIALTTSGVTLDVQARATYEMLTYGSKYLAIFFGVVTMWQYGKLYRQIRRIKYAKGVFTWSDAEGWVKVKAAQEPSGKSLLGRAWERFWKAV